MLIVLEGIDGAGTTTHVWRVSDALRGMGCKVHVTRQPSDRPIGVFIRRVLRGDVDVHRGGFTLCHLFAADRHDHIENEIKPAINDGYVVLCDRYCHSSFAYQTWHGLNGGGLDKQYVSLINDHVLVPDLTILLDVDLQVAMGRMKNRGKSDFTETQPYLEHANTVYKSMLSEPGFLFPGDIVAVDANQPIVDVTQQILSEIIIHHGTTIAAENRDA